MSLFGLFKKGPKVEGELGYFGLGDWWLKTFTERERVYIEKVYQPMSIGGSNNRPLTQGKIVSTSQTVVGLLAGLASWFQKPADRPIAKRILEKAEELGGKGNILDLHFLYQGMIQSAYKARDTDPASLDAAIEASEKQIALAPRAAKAFKREYPQKKAQEVFGASLPAHVGYTQLAIIREKQKDYAEAIRLATQAKKQGWNGDWDKRIERCKSKIQRQE